MLKWARGQTIVETVVALPIVLLALFGIIYLSKFGVVAERTQLALRYGGIVAFYSGSNAYSVANIYENLSSQAVPYPCPTAPLSAYTGASPFPGPSTPPFFQPDATNGSQSTAPTSGCVAGPYGFGGAQFLATHYFAVTNLNVNAGVQVPPYLQALIGPFSWASASAQFVHAASPGMILYCSIEVHDRVWGAITAESTTETPPPAPANNGACHN